MRLFPFWLWNLLVPVGLGVAGDAAGGGGGGADDGERSFSQAELDAAVAAQVAAAVAAAKAPFSGVNVDEYKRLKDDEVKRAEDDLKAKGQYEQLIANTVKEKDAALEKVQREAEERIRDLGAKLERSEVDGKLRSAAIALKALNPDQVVVLTRSSINYDPATGPSVVDGQGTVVTKNGKPISIEEMVASFLEANPHFLPAGPGGAGSQGSGGTGGLRDEFVLTPEQARDHNLYKATRDAALKAGKAVRIKS